MSRQTRDAAWMDYLADLLTVEPVPPLVEPAPEREPGPMPPVVEQVRPDPATPMAPQSVTPSAARPAESPLQDHADLPPVFDCLLFRVGPYRLALPLLGISSVHNMDEDVHELPGMVDWILGVVQLSRERLCLVDLIRLFGGGIARDNQPAVTESVQRLIVLYGSRWALASHEILEVRQLKRADVRWRLKSTDSARSWCVGTIASDLSLLIDPKALRSHLDGLLQAAASRVRAD